MRFKIVKTKALIAANSGDYWRRSATMGLAILDSWQPVMN